MWYLTEMTRHEALWSTSLARSDRFMAQASGLPRPECPCRVRDQYGLCRECGKHSPAHDIDRKFTDACKED